VRVRVVSTTAAYVLAAIGRREGVVFGPAIQGLFGAPLAQMSFACICGTPDRWVDTIGRFGRFGRPGRRVNVLLFSQDLLSDVQLAPTP